MRDDVPRVRIPKVMRDFECVESADAAPKETDGYASEDLFSCSGGEQACGSDPESLEEMTAEEFAAERAEMLRQARAMALQACQPSRMDMEVETPVYCRKRHCGKTTCPFHAPPSNATKRDGGEDAASDCDGIAKKARKVESHGQPKKAPAKRRPASQEVCCGTGGAICHFATNAGRIGERARVTPQRQQSRCVFCDPDGMRKAFANSRSKGVVTSAMRFFKDQGREDIYNSALDKIPEAERPRIEAAMLQPRRDKTFLQQRKQARIDQESWTTLLAQRQPVTANATAEDRRVYNQRVRNDKNRLRNKFPALHRARNAGDNTWRSPAATRFEAWCREDSWTMCRECHRLEPRPLREVDIGGKRGRQTHTTKRCRHCAHGVGYPTVQIEDIPEVLRGLSPASLWAISPLEIFNGPATWAKHGYRVHTDMTRFWWRPQRVLDQIAELIHADQEEDARRAQEAYDYLVQAPDSSWGKFNTLHRKFLEKNAHRLTGEIEEDWFVLQLPRTCIEEVGIECALWPHLYPRTTMCETHVRASHYTREGKPTHTAFDKKAMRARDKFSREKREALIHKSRPQSKEHRLALQWRFEEAIRNGHKTVEGRLHKGVAARIQIGDTLVLGSTRCVVKGVTHHWTFEEMLRAKGLRNVLPHSSSIGAGVQVYHGFPGFQAGEHHYGVVAFDLEVGAVKPKRGGFVSISFLNINFVVAI